MAMIRGPSVRRPSVVRRPQFQRSSSLKPLGRSIVKTENEKRRTVMKVQAFCEEKGLRPFLGVFGYAESKNQCWQAEKLLLHHLICIFPRWPPKLRKTSIAANWYMFRIPNCHKMIKITFHNDKNVLNV